MRNRSRFGWIELIEGILLIILGIFSFLRPDSMLSGFVMFFGLIALCIGILDIIFYVRTEEHVGFAPTIALIAGCLSVLAGLMLLVYPLSLIHIFHFLSFQLPHFILQPYNTFKYSTAGSSVPCIEQPFSFA